MSSQQLEVFGVHFLAEDVADLEESGRFEVVWLVDALKGMREVGEYEFVDVDADLGREFKECQGSFRLDVGIHL